MWPVRKHRPVRLPDALTQDTDERALALLVDYYGTPPGSGKRSGAAFDTWDSTGTRQRDLDRFTADDLVSITLLSVDLSGTAARRLLVSDSERFSGLLAAVGPDRDLVDVEALPPQGPEWSLMGDLRRLPGVGPTKASKLFARKRPRLRPIYDSVVAEVMDTRQQQWEPIRVKLRENNGHLHHRLLSLRDQAGLPPQVSALRVLDVIAWMEGKKAGVRSVPELEEALP